MADEAFNVLFQDAQVLKSKRKVPAGVSAADKHRNLKLEHSSPNATRSIVATSTPEAAAAAVQTSPAREPHKKPSHAALTQRTDEVDKAMLAAQAAACAKPSSDAKDVFEGNYETKVHASESRAVVANGQLTADDFEF